MEVRPDRLDLLAFDQDVGLLEVADGRVERQHDAALQQDAVPVAATARRVAAAPPAFVVPVAPVVPAVRLGLARAGHEAAAERGSGGDTGCRPTKEAAARHVCAVVVTLRVGRLPVSLAAAATVTVFVWSLFFVGAHYRPPWEYARAERNVAARRPARQIIGPIGKLRYALGELALLPAHTVSSRFVARCRAKQCFRGIERIRECDKSKTRTAVLS